MHSSLIAEVALILHIPISVILFATLPTERAVGWVLLSAALFLPEGIYFDPPGLPPFGKFSIPALVTYIALYAKKVEGSKRSSPLFPLIVTIILVGAFGTVMTNGDPLLLAPGYIAPPLTMKDVINLASVRMFDLILPFLIGRKVYRTPQAVNELLRIVAMLGVIYGFLMLIELRMSPVLNIWVYGYHQHSFAQAVREGGYRPTVFMGHGLAVTLFCATTIFAAVTLAKKGERIFKVKAGHWALFLGVILMFSNSMGALIYAVLVTPVIWKGKPGLLSFVATFVAFFVLSVPILRTNGWMPLEDIVEFFAGISTERAASLEFRFDQEEALLEKFRLRPYFGWGGYGRGRLYDEEGRDISVTDGEWMIALNSGGVFAFVGEFLLLLAPVWIARRHMKNKKIAPPIRNLFAGLAMMVAVSVLDLIPNGLFSFLPVIYAGALFGFSESLSDPAEQKRMTAEAMAQT